MVNNTKMLGNLKDRKSVLILLLFILFLLKIPKEGARYVIWVLSGTLICAFADFLFNKIKHGNNIFPFSAIISGIIVCGILDYNLPWFILVLFSLIPIVAKHFIKINKKPIFNPANLSLFLATLFRIPLSWTIDSNMFLVGISGIFFAYSYKKFSQVIGFVSVFLALFMLYNINSFGLISWFFVFIMLIEPKTSGAGGLKGFTFGGIAGLVAFFMFKSIPRYDAFVTSLFFANLLNFFWREK